MRTRAPVAATSSALACLFVVGIAARAAEIKVLSAVPMRPVMEDIGPKFEHVTGHKLTVTFDTLEKVVKRIQDGEFADVVVIPRQGTDTLVNWSFMAQPDHLFERMIAAIPPREFVLRHLSRTGKPAFFDDRAVAEYIRCFTPKTIHGVLQRTAALRPPLNVPPPTQVL